MYDLCEDLQWMIWRKYYSKYIVGNINPTIAAWKLVKLHNKIYAKV